MEKNEQQQHIAIDAQPAAEEEAVKKKTEAVPVLEVLTRFHAGYFRITLSLSAQSLLWKTLREPPTDGRSLHPFVRGLPSAAFLLLWSLSLAALLLLSLLFLLRCLLRPASVRTEFRHYVGVNYLFAPWISWLLLLQAAPSAVLPKRGPPHRLLWLAFSAPILALDVKVYGQWFTKGKRLLSAVANPASQMTVIGNLAAARAAAGIGWREGAVGLFSVGMAHYLVLFVTLYQRLAGDTNALPVALRPVFFLFFATPSVASLAWYAIAGSFDLLCRMLFFLSLFLFASLVSRPVLFKRSMRRFNVAWWAYSFPLTVLALAATRYAQDVRGASSDALMLVLSALSVLVTLAVMLFTALTPAVLLPRHDPFLPSPPLHACMP